MPGPELQEEVKRKIQTALPGAQVFLRDYTGEGNHFEAHIVWSGFEGMSQVQQHRKVYEALEGIVGGDAPVHALSMKTWVTAPEGLQIPPDAEFPPPGN
ncbi:MAG: BolA/IbaG family iron-sulfur metabolism protein [Acidobacteriota bacterium]